MRKATRILLIVSPLLFSLTACGQENEKTGLTEPGDHIRKQENTALISEEKPVTESEDTTPDYEQIMRDAGLVNIQEQDPTIQIDLRYSTSNNFLHFDVYGKLNKVFLHKDAAVKLVKAQKNLKKKKPGYSLVVFDGARPQRVQFTMWEILDIPNKIDYLADPKKGSVHNYGMAVDLSIVDEKGKELDMGTEFDYFGVLARPDSEDSLAALGKLSKPQLANRQLLRTVMKQAGFFPIKTEWWHFTARPSDEVRRKYPIVY